MFASLFDARIDGKGLNLLQTNNIVFYYCIWHLPNPSWLVWCSSSWVQMTPFCYIDFLSCKYFDVLLQLNGGINSVNFDQRKTGLSRYNTMSIFYECWTWHCFHSDIIVVSLSIVCLSLSLFARAIMHRNLIRKLNYHIYLLSRAEEICI